MAGVPDHGGLEHLEWYIFYLALCKAVLSASYAGAGMLKNYITITVRNLMRQKLYFAINILGLSVGLACCMLIFCYVNYEYQYDQHHPNVGRIYKVLLKKRSLAGNDVIDPTTAGILAPTLQAEYPDVELGLRTLVRSIWVSSGQVAFRQSVCFADAHIMDMFSYPLVSGDPQGLHTSYGAFITASIARKFFGNANPLGKRLKTDYKWGLQGEYTVVGILADMPETSTYDLRFDMLTATIPPGTDFERRWTNWSSLIKSYIMLKPDADARALEAKLPAILEKYWPEEQAKNRTYYLQPVSRIHLYSAADYGLLHVSYGDITRVHTFLLIAGFILLIACINFMNLTTAQSMRRAQEVGMRKVVGAVRRQLIGQFLTESVLLTFIALILALGIVALALPYLSAVLNQDLTAIQVGRWIPVILIITVMTGFISGSYPAFYLSKFQPVDVLKGSSVSTGQKQLRQLLVVFQFATAIGLLIGTTVAYEQTMYIQNKHLGFETEQIIMVPIFFADRSLSARYETIKQAFLQHPNIQKASATWIAGGRVVLADVEPIKTASGSAEIQAALLFADHDFLDTFNIPLLSGQNLSTGGPTWNELILNEEAVRMLQLENPVGTEVDMWNRKWTIVGVVRDFHTRSLREPIGPIAIMKNNRYNQLNLKIGIGDFEETLSFLKTQWRHFVPDKPFSFRFVDDFINGFYQKEMQMSQFLGLFALLAIFISCLGVLGLAAFSSAQRLKEIGVRKILGASTPQIVLILSKELLMLVTIGNLIAWPIAYWTMNQWLQNFVYRTDLSPWIFILSGGLATLIAGSISGYQAFKAARANPVDALRYE